MHFGFLPENDKFGTGKIVTSADAKPRKSCVRKESTVADRNEEEKLLNEVLPNVAAQMRGPLSILHASLQKLVREGAPGTDLLNQSYHRLLRLAGNLSAAELLDGKAALREQRNEDVVALCARLSDRLRPLVEGEGLEYRFVCAQPSCVILCSGELLERLVLNLVSNAVKFTPAGGTVTLSLQVRPGNVVLSVADTGCGIAPDKMETLFDRYLHSERMDPMPHGLGLGLPLCRAIAEAHGGRILAESQVGKGTRITVTLPNEKSPVYRINDPAFDYVGGFDHVLVEMADALSPKAYAEKSAASQ